MGIRDALSALFEKKDQYPIVEFDEGLFTQVQGMSPERLYRTQPHLRTVISFRARNVAQLGWQVFERVSDTDRRRLRDDPIAQLLSAPNEDTTSYELFYALVSDLDLYDIAYWFVYSDDERPSGWAVRPIPPSWVTKVKDGNAFSPGTFVVKHPNATEAAEISAKDMIVFHGWNPGKPRTGSSPVEALKEVLAEQIQAWQYRQQLWKRGGRVGTYLTRPKDAPKWDDNSRKRFKLMWSEFSGSGAKAGSTPLLEDGIEMKRIGFSAREDEWIDAAKLSLATCASVYHINPVMVGQLDEANFGNTKEFRKMLYSDSLGPTLRQIADRINTFLVPRVTSKPGVYVEANIQAKLAGDFEEQAAVMSKAIGAPWMTRNEGRSMRNLPHVEGGDDLVTPLNVLIGGQASPEDGETAGGGGSLPVVETVKGFTADELGKLVTAAGTLIRAGFAPEASLAAVGLDPIEHTGLLPVTVRDEEKKSSDVISAFLERQSEVVSAKRAGGVANWWDRERWDRELTEDLMKAGMQQHPAFSLARAVNDRVEASFPREVEST